MEKNNLKIFEKICQFLELGELEQLDDYFKNSLKNDFTLKSMLKNEIRRKLKKVFYILLKN